MRRGGRASLTGVVVASLLIALSATPSAATWRDREHVSAAASAVDCTLPGSVDSTAGGRMLTGTLLGRDLAPVAALGGIQVSNLDPATSSTADAAGVPMNLGSDAWSSDLALSALSSLDVGAGVVLPFGANTGVYSQYGRATSTGVAVGAAGAVTSSSGGLAALESPTSATPRLADLRLSTLLDSSLPGLGVATVDLADVALRIGTVGAIASIDSCSQLWTGAADPGVALQREYLLQDLGVDFTSGAVGAAVTEARTSIGALETELDALAGPGTPVTGSALTSLTDTLSSILDLEVLGVDISLASVDALTVSLDVEVDPALAAVSGVLTDGVVHVDLASGRISADLDALFDAAYGGIGGLNGLAPNTSVFTEPVMSELIRRVGVVVAAHVGGTVGPALDAALRAATVTVDLDATLRTRAQVLFTTIDVLGLALHSTITGSVASFTGIVDAPPPVAATTVTQSPTGIGGILALLGISLDGVVNGLLAAIATPLVTTLVPAIGTLVVAPSLTTATTMAAATVASIGSTTVPALLTALAPVLDALSTLVRVTVNGRPDRPGSVGAPGAWPAGRWWQTALHVGVVNGGGASLAALFFANAFAGPTALRH